MDTEIFVMDELLFSLSRLEGVLDGLVEALSSLTLLPESTCSFVGGE